VRLRVAAGVRILRVDPVSFPGDRCEARNGYQAADNYVGLHAAVEAVVSLLAQLDDRLEAGLVEGGG